LWQRAAASPLADAAAREARTGAMSLCARAGTARSPGQASGPSAAQRRPPGAAPDLRQMLTLAIPARLKPPSFPAGKPWRANFRTDAASHPPFWQRHTVRQKDRCDSDPAAPRPDQQPKEGFGRGLKPLSSASRARGLTPEIQGGRLISQLGEARIVLLIAQRFTGFHTRRSALNDVRSLSLLANISFCSLAMGAPVGRIHHSAGGLEDASSQSQVAGVLASSSPTGGVPRVDRAAAESTEAAQPPANQTHHQGQITRGR